MNETQLSFLEQVYRLSPAVFALVVFFTVAVFLNKIGLLNFKDPVDDDWRAKLQNSVDEAHRDIAALKTTVAILSDRWDRR